MLAGLRISPELYRQIVDHLLAALPNESVGLIAAVPDDGYYVAVAFFPGTNIDHSPTRYTMDPAEVLSALREMEANGWQLGAIAHSHVGSPPTPSTTDLRETYYPEALQLIARIGDSAAKSKIWRMPAAGSSRGPTEVSLLIEEAGQKLRDRSRGIGLPQGTSRLPVSAYLTCLDD